MTAQDTSRPQSARDLWTTTSTLDCDESFHTKRVMRRGLTVIAVPSPCDDPECRVLIAGYAYRAQRMAGAAREFYHQKATYGSYLHSASAGTPTLLAVSDNAAYNRHRKRIYRAGVWGYAFPVSAALNADPISQMMGRRLFIAAEFPSTRSYGDTPESAPSPVSWDSVMALMPRLIKDRPPKHQITSINLPTSDPRLRDCPECPHLPGRALPGARQPSPLLLAPGPHQAPLCRSRLDCL